MKHHSPAEQGKSALVTFVTAGYPRVNDTVPLCLAMQKGGADIIELGVPFSDPIADGHAIQETNTVRSPLITCSDDLHNDLSRSRSKMTSIMPLYWGR
jgi:tryptophan synthase alpha subunit